MEAIIKWGNKVKAKEMSWKEAAIECSKEIGENLTGDALRKRYSTAVEKSGMTPEEFYDQKPNGSIEISSNIWVNKDFKKTPDNVMEILGYDKELWQLVSFRVGSHEVAISDEDTNRVCYNFRAVLKPTELQLSSTQAIEEANKLFGAKIVPFAFKPTPRVKGLSKDKLLLMPTIEAHLGKMASEMETGTNYDHKICRERFYEVFAEFLNWQLVEKADSCLVVIGGDFFNSESDGMTTGKTPQANDTRFRKMFSLGLEMYTKAILGLEDKFNRVTIMFAPGNHARAMEYFLYRALEQYFMNNKKIDFTEDYKNTQAYQFNDTALFFNHGDVNHKRLVASIPAEFNKMYGDTNFRYLFVGHLHHQEVLKEENGLMVIRTSSISETDEWHYQQRFGVGNVPKQEMYLFSGTQGMIASRNVVFGKARIR